ncbi:MAG TPA: XdhC family protein [Myxococcaceae bacterium]|nr:XdhC family protein [Myxococcaceae bacterium]
MRELHAIAESFEQARANGKATALATVVSVRGSAYRRPGARMLITEEGQTTGTISGGCLERDVILRGQRAIERGEATLATYDSTDEHEIDFGAGLGCGGVVQILIEPLPASEPGHLPIVNELLRRRERGVLATVWQASSPANARRGSRLLLGSDGELWADIESPELAAWIEEDAWHSLRTRRSAVQTYELPAGHFEVLLEVLQPPVSLVVFGGGYDAVPLVQFACEVGWHVTVVDGRPAAASRTRFPRADEVVLCRPEQVRDQVAMTSDMVAVVMTHNYRNDLELLKLLLPSPAAYVGLLGSKIRSARLLQELEDTGIKLTVAQRSKLHAPIGLDIGAETCEEIALAIVAEIRAVLAGRAGGRLKERRAPIHERARSEEVRRPRMVAVVESAACG